MSIPESSSSLDVVMGAYPDYVDASIDYADDSPYLRVAASAQKKDKDSESEDNIKKKILQWKKHTKEFATSSGFRKAHLGSRKIIDPKRFALHLANAAYKSAMKSNSRPLAKLAKRLFWISKQDSRKAAQELSRVTSESNNMMEPNDNTIPTIEKPREQVENDQIMNNSETSSVPGELADSPTDYSWRSRESKRRRRHHDMGEIKEDTSGDLLSMARDFLLSYQSQNSLSDYDDFLDNVESSNVFDSWIMDLNNKGIDADPGDLDKAWSEALSEISEGDNLEPPVMSSKDERPIDRNIQPYTAPGGDWSNTIIRMEENPVMDRYLQRMGPTTKVQSRQAGLKGVALAVDQCLDNYAGEMVPNEISPDHVQNFVEDAFPNVPWKKVYEEIKKLSDPKRRHEDEPKERTNQEASRKKVGARRKAGNNQSFDNSSYSPFDDIVTPKKKSLYSRVRGCKEICNACRGTGEERQGTCMSCSGSGRQQVNPHDEDLEHKGSLVEKLGSLLVVSIDAKGNVLSSVPVANIMHSRIAANGKRVLMHSPELMKYLIKNNIPYRTANFKHRSYR